MADLGPGTMPRGKYPESPAPAGSHALISRTPPPGGMLHANLGLPRPTPRNFQPPLPRFPSRLSPRRMSGTTVGEDSFTPAPAANTCPRNNPQNKRQQHSPPIVIPESPASAGRSAPRSHNNSQGHPTTPPTNLQPLVQSLLWRHACLTTPVVKRPLPQPFSE